MTINPSTPSAFDPAIAIELAAIAYDSSRVGVSAQLQALPTSLGGPWKLRWLAVDGANQMYLAQSASAGQAVAIRGSVTDPFTLAFWLDWFQQDLNAFKHRPWVFGRLPAGSMISQGTVDGINSLIGLRDQGLTISQMLSRGATTAPVPIVGHSLGGGLAAAFAPWLEHTMSQLTDFDCRCLPLTFAAPAVGNDAFADGLENAYQSGANRYHNTLDVVPHAWAGLEWITSSFAGGPGIPEVLRLAVEVVREYLHKEALRYRQPGADVALNGSLTQHVSWVSEVGIQHGTANYRQLIKNRAEG